MSWYFRVLKKYAVFSGRATRKEYWIFDLINFLVCIGLIVLDALTGTTAGFGVLFGLYVLAMILPTLAVSVRRLHDIGRSGWWLPIAFVPLIGGLVLLVFVASESQESANKYGPNPKQAVASFGTEHPESA